MGQWRTERKLIAGLLHVRVRCTVCGEPCWTRFGAGFDAERYACLDCAPMPRDERQAETDEGMLGRE